MVREISAVMETESGGLKREVLALVGLVLAVDAVFIAGYYLAGLARATTGVKLGYTVLWTAVILAVVLRSLGRVRAERIRRRH
jgi:hypothetical protein